MAKAAKSTSKADAKKGSKKKREGKAKTKPLEDRDVTITDYLNEASRRWRENDEIRARCCMTWGSFSPNDLGRSIVAFTMSNKGASKLSKKQRFQMYDWPPVIHELIHWVVLHATCQDPKPIPIPNPKPDPDPFPIPDDFPFAAPPPDRFPTGPLEVHWETEVGDPPSVTVQVDTHGHARVLFTVREIV